MRQSKARDVSVHNDLVTNLQAGSPLTFVLPRDNKRTRAVKIDLSEAASLGRIANEMAGFLVQSLTGTTSQTASSRYGSIRRFMLHLAGSVQVPIMDWTDVDWEMQVNEWIRTRQERSTSDGYANAERGNIKVFFKSIFRSGKIGKFDFFPPIKNAKSAKKPDLASIPQSRPFDYTAMTGDQAVTARRLEKLTRISDPKVHLERLRILYGLLREHASSTARRYWAKFEMANHHVRGEIGLDVENFLSEYKVSNKPWKFRRGWQKALQEKRDRTRFLCHPEIYYGALLSPDENCVKKWLSEKGYGVPETCGELHATIPNVIPLMTLIIMDLDLEESSALGMKSNCYSILEGGKAVSIQWLKTRIGEMQSETRPVGSKSALHRDSTEAISSYQALQFLADLRSKIQGLAPAEDSHMAFLVCNQFARPNIVHLLTDQGMAGHFQRFLAPHPILGAFHFTPDKLRGTGVLEEQLNHGDLLKTNKRARHKSLETTKKYTNTVSADHQEQAQRREVQDLLLMNALPEHSELRERLGLDSRRIEHITEQTVRSGFLEWFATPGVKPEEKAQEKRSAFMEMLLEGDHVILEDPEVAAELIAYRRHLLEDHDVLRQTGEWEDVWAPMILLLTKFLEAMRADIRLAGEKIAIDHEIEYSEDY